MRAKGNLFVSQNTPVIKRYYHQHIIQESLDLYVSEPETVCHLMIGCPQFAQLNYTDASLQLSTCTEKSVGTLLFKYMNYGFSTRPTAQHKIEDQTSVTLGKLTSIAPDKEIYSCIPCNARPQLTSLQLFGCEKKAALISRSIVEL